MVRKTHFVAIDNLPFIATKDVLAIDSFDRGATTPKFQQRHLLRKFQPRRAIQTKNNLKCHLSGLKSNFLPNPPPKNSDFNSIDIKANNNIYNL
jgi:hypothetical protein